MVGLTTVFVAAILASVTEVGFTLVVGWLAFLRRVVPQIAWSGEAIITGAIALGVLAGGIHGLGRAWSGRQVEGVVRKWPIRWTVALVGAFVLMFVAGLSWVGLWRTIAWYWERS